MPLIRNLVQTGQCTSKSRLEMDQPAGMPYSVSFTSYHILKKEREKKIIKKKIQPKAFVQFQWTCGMEQVHQIFKQFLQTHKLDKTSKVRQPLNQSISRPCCSLLDPVTDFYCILFKYEIWRETSAIRISSKMMTDQLGVLNHTAI